MKQSEFKSYDELPLLLNAKTVAQVLGISAAGTYELLHRGDFPVVKIGSCLVVRGSERKIPHLGRGTSGR